MPWRCPLDDLTRGGSPEGESGSAQPTGSQADEPAAGTQPSQSADATGSAPPGAPAGRPAARRRTSRSARPAAPKPPSLGEQWAATRAAGVNLIQAHIALAKAEFAEIGAEIKRFAAAGGIAFAAGLFVAILVPIGLSLFVGEWLFGSIGWGVAVFTALAIAIAVTAVLRVLGATNGQIVGSVLFGIVVGIFVGVVLGLDLTNQAWSRLGDQVFPNVDAAVRPLVTAIAFTTPIFGVLGFILGIRGGGFSGGIGGLVVGALLGVLLGALTAARWGPNAGAGMGVTVGLATWTLTLVALVQRRGIDWDAIKIKLTPDVTMDTTRETMEWVRTQMPLGRKS